MWLDALWNTLTGSSSLREAWGQCEKRMIAMEEELAKNRTQTQKMNQKLDHLESRVDEWLGVKGHV